MKKIVLWLLIALSLFSTALLSVSGYTYNSWSSIWTNIDGFLSVPGKDSLLVSWSDVRVNFWFKERIIKWVTNISVFMSIIAVGSIVYWAFMLTVSVWEDEKIKKWKDIVKWWIIGFLAIISAWWLIRVIIIFIYWVAK